VDAGTAVRTLRDAGSELYACAAFGEYMATGGADCTLRVYGPGG